MISYSNDMINKIMRKVGGAGKQILLTLSSILSIQKKHTLMERNSSDTDEQLLNMVKNVSNTIY